MSLRIGPISPKAHGAWLGSGFGAALANVIIGELQTYVTHGPLPQSSQALIYVVVPAVLAFLASYIAPALPSSLLQQASLITPYAQLPPRMSAAEERARLSENTTDTRAQPVLPSDVTILTPPPGNLMGDQPPVT